MALFYWHEFLLYCLKNISNFPPQQCILFTAPNKWFTISSNRLKSKPSRANATRTHVKLAPISPNSDPSSLTIMFVRKRTYACADMGIRHMRQTRTSASNPNQCVFIICIFCIRDFLMRFLLISYSLCFVEVNVCMFAKFDDNLYATAFPLHSRFPLSIVLSLSVAYSFNNFLVLQLIFLLLLLAENVKSDYHLRFLPFSNKFYFFCFFYSCHNNIVPL